MPTNYILASLFYLLSGLLDAFDGWAARRYDQGRSRFVCILVDVMLVSKGTSFGAVLDMVTDRCATTCLIIVLAFFYPHWLLLWQTIVALDISSHWIQMYMSLLHGETTHKVTNLSANPIMRIYYSRVRQ